MANEESSSAALMAIFVNLQHARTHTCSRRTINFGATHIDDAGGVIFKNPRLECVLGACRIPRDSFTRCDEILDLFGADNSDDRVRRKKKSKIVSYRLHRARAIMEGLHAQHADLTLVTYGTHDIP